jgi:tetratricopeptide (TPR) repeat protein
MTRTTRYKLGYVAALAALGAVAVTSIVGLGGGFVPVIVVAAILLVPGRLLGIAYRDLFRGRRLLDLRQAEASIAYTQRFLDYIRRHPARKRLLWLAWSVYTPDAEAMALNNLGAAHLETGSFAAASDALKSAMAVDPQCPLPYHNLAIERAAANDNEEAARLAVEAEKLGFRRTRIDDIIRESQSLLARLEGRGVTAAPAAN